MSSRATREVAVKRKAALQFLAKRASVWCRCIATDRVSISFETHQRASFARAFSLCADFQRSIGHGAPAGAPLNSSHLRSPRGC